MRLTPLAVAFLMMLIVVRASAQNDNKHIDSILTRVGWYALKKPSATLYVHFDKNIFTNNENVWFTGYLLNSNTRGEHHTLSVALIRNDDRSILTSGKFVLNKTLAFGNLFLPDSLPTGDYSFICYTNVVVNGAPPALFVQPVTIKTTKANGFISNLSLADSLRPGADSVVVLLKSYTQEISLVRGADVTYYVGDRSKPLIWGKLKTDNFGEAKIQVPVKALTGENNILQAEISSKNEIRTFNLRLPVYKKEFRLKCYPEGGNLVNGSLANIGFEVVNEEGKPEPVNGFLLENGAQLHPVQTNAFGMGKFQFIPQPGKHYQLKLNNSPALFPLPPALDQGPVLHVGTALTDDTLVIQLKHTVAGQNWSLLVHNYRSVFLNASVISSGKMMTIKVPLDEVPKGLNTVTIVDSGGRPWAERLFYAHFNKNVQVNISTDSSSYVARQKVNIKFRVTDTRHQPLKSMVSIACVQDNRLDVKKMTDITSFHYLRHELQSFPFKTNLRSSDSETREYLENLLLVKGWRRYTWQDLSTTTATDTLTENKSLAFTGKAVLKRRQSPLPLDVLVVKLPEVDLVGTDSSGNFTLPQSVMIAPFDKQLQLSVNGKQEDQYTIVTNDPYKAMNQKLAQSLVFDDFSTPNFMQTSQSVVLKSEEGGKRLLDVTVTKKKDNRVFAYGANVCGDYVCMYNILNCPNHPFGGSQPVMGRSYGIKGSSSSVIYKGCAELEKENRSKLFLVDAVYRAKEFYVADYAKFNPPASEFLSTLYWKHAQLTNENGEAEISFYTGDIPGKFRVVIQGLTTDDVLYGEQVFTVKEQ
ncbi:hypothetical protein EXU57_04095 [Segetibacter sp. 3557_3]|uniref:hypothetical protein n=1 Tax=Segetibacter sp. 3557_3 TaxID=2547429 RepID=UPI001058FC73|nr:hypothetical protein [Segetibacter sp. 3557_3]TDH29255.1 hypothetical protein EXU57_04095 [Segetibacter sp. 3557_3]